ncbi:hypothetical protein BC939DRAFT_448525 [Gamsiella multidivaricata]|uniref:uncharacterized protein n=1 Tax=Gamsiella multidivaricata TaxID=101098 RepID=UPI002220EB06|nr:uncharacterized protein BC939DRAFT_448525 [Gamsiella multidivaricata]KAG0360816.1 hypothetical protein BGZ54_009378 [Gamsiella multidivaricata]KAI7825323.1 hypothetical protein BC939DRAFT_448525 [Gamsiella multidivaricata]
MSSFTLETTLDTKTPDVIEFLGPPSAAIQHQISGTLRLRVQKAVQLKQLSVVFHGEAHFSYTTSVVGVAVQSDGVNIAHIEVQLIKSTTQYQPGEYTFPFQLSLPGDLVTTASSSLKSSILTWTYELISTAMPTGLFARRRVAHQPLALKRVNVQPSDTSSVRYGVKRPDEFECSMYAPKFIGAQETKIHLSVYSHPYKHTYRVKEILAQAIQMEKVCFDSRQLEKSIRRIKESLPSGINPDPIAIKTAGITDEDDRPSFVKTDNAKALSKTITLANPDQEEFSAAWGREHPIEFELDIDPGEMVPDETLDWIKIAHGVRFTIVFVDPNVRNLVVMAPFQVSNVLEEGWSTHPAPEGLTPPDYGVDDGHSTLLDSNTTRMSRQQLHRELYPERELIVPDLADDLPPVYEHEEESPVPYTEKQEP